MSPRPAGPKKAKARAATIPWDALFAAAADFRKRAHAPYSKFQVGAAVLTDDGRILGGCNVENSSYGVSVCAERSAISRMVGEGGSRVAAVALVVDTPEPCPPCGMCRQTLAEFAGPDVPVRSRTLKGREARWTLRQLLPFAFTRAFF